MATDKIKYHLQAGVNWKYKAKSRQHENKYLRQRIKELTQSRNKWKEKAMNREKKPANGFNEPLAYELKKKRYLSLATQPTRS